MSVAFTNPNLNELDEEMRKWHMEETYGRLCRTAKNIVRFALMQRVLEKELLDAAEQYRSEKIGH